MHSYLNALYKATEDALRTAAFGFVSRSDVPDVDCPAVGDALVGSRIDFDGPIRGSVLFIVPEQLATYLTANMTARDEDDPATLENRADAMCEILNMICGRFLPKIRPEAGEFRIGIPRPEDGPSLLAAAARLSVDGVFPDGAFCLEIEVEGSPARLILEVEETGVGGPTQP